MYTYVTLSFYLVISLCLSWSPNVTQFFMWMFCRYLKYIAKIKLSSSHPQAIPLAVFSTLQSVLYWSTPRNGPTLFLTFICQFGHKSRSCYLLVLLSCISCPLPVFPEPDPLICAHHLDCGNSLTSWLPCLHFQPFQLFSSLPAGVVIHMSFPVIKILHQFLSLIG
jgi:hypothetical protein